MNDTPASNASARADGAHEPSHAASRLQHFEKRQNELWTITLSLLFFLTVVFAWLSWPTIRTSSFRLEAFPIGLVVLVALFGVYIWKKTQEISELRGLVRGFEHRESVPPSEKQVQQLFDLISKSQQGYRDLIDSFDDVLMALSLEGDIRAVNRSFAELLGLPYQQIIGRNLSELLEDASGGGEESLARGLAKFLERRHWAGVAQIRLKHRNAVFYFDCVAHAMLREDKVNGLTVLARDITSARRNEARFTELFETLQEGIYIVTPDDRIADVNPALVRMLGYDSKEDLLSHRVTDVFSDESQREVLIREVMRQPSPVAREITLRRKDGSPIICLNTSAAVRDTAGRVVRYQGALVDVTEQRAIEKRLYKEQEFARRLVDSFPDLIFVINKNREYTFVSPKVKEVLGYEISETRGMVFGDRTHTEDVKGIQETLDHVLSGRRSFASIEVRVRHKNGEWRRLRCHFSPLFNEEGKIEGVVVSGRDVTEVKRLEEQLIQAEKLAAMGQMLAGVAHELNNPLTAILGVSELLRDRPGVDEHTKRQLDVTHRQARRAARIVQNLLEFSRPAASQKRILDLNSVLDRTLQLQEHSLRRNAVTVEFHPQTALPRILGDANQLIQVFLNLLTNAEQAIRAERPSGHIRIRVGQSGGNVWARVEDDGPGIKPEVLPKLFDPFFTTKRPGGGTGLGLSICMSIVREHGGNIEAETVPSSGAAFTVSFPARQEMVDASPARGVDTSSHEWFPPSLESLSKRRVLVLDDEESIRMLLSEGLSANGLQVDCASSAEQAMSLILGGKYEVLLCDLQLAGSGPNADGYDVAKRLQIAAGTNRPEVIFMSGDLISSGATLEKNPRARKLQKPFRIADVLMVLMEIFSTAPVGAGKR